LLLHVRAPGTRDAADMARPRTGPCTTRGPRRETRATTPVHGPVEGRCGTVEKRPSDARKRRPDRALGLGARSGPRDWAPGLGTRTGHPDRAPGPSAQTGHTD